MASKFIELENQTRGVLHFPILSKATDTAPAKEVGRLVLGDAADKIVEGPRDEKLQPSPVQKITEAQWAALGERNLKTLNALIARGDVQRRDLVA